MEACDIVKMLEHYFARELTNKERLRVYDAIHGNQVLNRPELNLTPAQVEQIAAEHDYLEDMIHALEMKGKRMQPVDRRTSSQVKIAFGV
jgi:hypothetical protein